MPDHHQVLTTHGWEEDPAHPHQYTHKDHHGHRIHIDDPNNGTGWRCHDADGHLIGHSRYNTQLHHWLAQRAQSA